jgi:hypothetical protein
MAAGVATDDGQQHRYAQGEYLLLYGQNVNKGPHFALDKARYRSCMN